MHKRYIHVMAGVIVNAAGEILIARRPVRAHQGGLWEFPGGKLEPGESPVEALSRELHEELGIAVTACRPQIQIRHDYGDKQVFLDVWRVEAFDGEPHGREGQPVRWVRPEALAAFEFPAANRPIVTAAQLPPRYLITPEPVEPAEFLVHLATRLAAGLDLVQLRAKSLSGPALRELASEVKVLCLRHGARWLLNGDAELARAYGADGVHLPAASLARLVRRPEGLALVAASCHTPEELKLAEGLGCDFAVLSPVLATASHPGAAALGWLRFRECVAATRVPVYALGGLSEAELEQAWAAGAQGIAAIRGLWD